MTAIHVRKLAGNCRFPKPDSLVQIQAGVLIIWLCSSEVEHLVESQGVGVPKAPGATYARIIWLLVQPEKPNGCVQIAVWAVIAD